jgi:hypothetical protein
MYGELKEVDDCAKIVYDSQHSPLLSRKIEEPRRSQPDCNLLLIFT